MRAFVCVGFTNGQGVGSKLLVHKSVGDARSERGAEVEKRGMTDSRLRSSSVCWRFGRGD